METDEGGDAQNESDDKLNLTEASEETKPVATEAADSQGYDTRSEAGSSVDSFESSFDEESDESGKNSKKINSNTVNVEIFVCG